MSVLTGVATGLAGAAVRHVVNEGQLLLVVGIMNGQPLAHLLWFVTGLSAIVLGVVGFRLFVIGWQQVVIEDTGSSYGPSWRFYVGGPFLYDKITAPATTVECAELSTAVRTTFEDGEYLLRTGKDDKDVIIYTAEGQLTCDHGDVLQMVLPD